MKNFILMFFRDGVIEVPKLHSGAVKGLCSSIFQPNLIATGAANGEVKYDK